MRREIESIHAFGAELVVIGNGTRYFAGVFREDLQLETPLYVDTTCASYRALGMKRGLVRTLGSWRTWVSYLRALRNGFRQKRLGVIVRWQTQVDRTVSALPAGVDGARSADVRVWVLRPVVWFAAASMVTTVLHELAHVCAAFALGVRSTLFNYSANLDLTPVQAASNLAVPIRVAGPLFCLACGMVSWLAFRRARGSAVELPVLYLQKHMHSLIDYKTPIDAESSLLTA